MGVKQEDITMEDNNVGTQGQQTESNAQQPQIVVLQPQAAPQQPQPQQTTPNQSNVGLFTQEQVNAIVSGRVSQLNAKISEMTKTIETLTADTESYKTKIADYETSSALTKAGIPDSLTDYVKFEVGKLSSNGKSFADNLNDYVKANQSFIDSIKQQGQANQQNNGNGNGAGAAAQSNAGMQSPLLQQLAGKQASNTNGAGTASVQSGQGLSGIDVDAVLAKEGLKRRK